MAANNRIITSASWDANGDRLYETGVKNGVLYPFDSTSKKYSPGVVWNGLTSVSETPSGAEATDLYADDSKYLSLYSAEELGLTIEAYTYPDEFAILDGSVSPSDVPGMIFGQQARGLFGLSYITTLGNDVSGNNYGYKLHLVYGCKASPSDRQYSTINDSPEAITFSWELSTQKVDVSDNESGLKYDKVSIITIDSTKFTTDDEKARLEALLDKLYGQEAVEGETAEDGTPEIKPYLPLPGEVYNTLKPPVVEG